MIFIVIAHIHMKTHTQHNCCIQNLKVNINFIVQILILYRAACKKIIKLKCYP